MQQDRYFDLLVEHLSLKKSERGLVLVTHMLPDRVAFIASLQRLFAAVTAIAIPYSVDLSVLERCPCPVLTPTMGELDSETWTRNTFEALARRPTVVLEIGGYFSGLAHSAADHPLLVGCVEDTEAGHRRYASRSPAVPVISVARSPLKSAEDILIGASIAHSVEHVVRLRSCVLAGMKFVILGFGKVGESVALQLRMRGALVLVVEPSASRALRAIAHGFALLDHSSALSLADGVVACTGRPSLRVTDLDLLQDGCLLFSGSSRQVEYEEVLPMVAGREGRFSRVPIDVRTSFIVDEGYPTNFADGAEVGPILRAPQGELIVGAASVHNYPPGMNELSDRVREAIANTWRQAFPDARRQTTEFWDPHLPSALDDHADFGQPHADLLP